MGQCSTGAWEHRPCGVWRSEIRNRHANAVLGVFISGSLEINSYRDEAESSERFFFFLLNPRFICN